MRRLTMRITSLRSILLVGLAIMSFAARSSASNSPIPLPKVDDQLAAAPGKQTAVFAGGCFWGTQAVFERLKGVVATTVGYSGGKASTAHYSDVTTETTGHAES